MARALNPKDAEVFNEPVSPTDAGFAEAAEHLLKPREDGLEIPPEMAFWFGAHLFDRRNS